MAESTTYSLGSLSRARYRVLEYRQVEGELVVDYRCLGDDEDNHVVSEVVVVKNDDVPVGVLEGD